VSSVRLTFCPGGYLVTDFYFTCAASEHETDIKCIICIM